MPDVAGPPAAWRVELHFEQVDQRAATGEHAVAFEQRLPLEDLEVEILSERVHKIFVRHRWWKLRFGAHALDCRGEHGLQQLTLMAQGLRLVRGHTLRDGVYNADAVRLALIFRRHPELLDAAQDDVVAAFAERLRVGDDAGAADVENRRPTLVVRFIAGAEQHHADDAIALQRIRRHRAIARLEDVQRKEDVWK